MVPLLFSNMNAFHELFCCCFALFDIVWKDMNGNLLTMQIILDEVKSRIGNHIFKQQVRKIQEF